MKKTTILFAVAALIATTCFSQDKGYIGISLGPSIPINDFASRDGNNNSAGWATTGANFDITFVYKLGKSLGLSALLRGQANSVDNIAYSNELTKQVGGSWTVDSKSWTMGGLLFGGYGSFPISDKVSFDTRAVIGFLNATSPELNLTLNGSGGAGWVRQSSVSANSFTYLLGAGFKFGVSNKICLLANLDYLGAKPEFRDVELTSGSGGAPTKYTFSQKFGTINFGFGVGLRL
jgi:hypothetical protein